MQRKSMPSAHQWLQGGIAPGLVRHLADLCALASWLEGELPSSLGLHCHLINLRGHTVILGASSPVWASRLRFHADQLLAAMQRDLPLRVSKVQVKVSPKPSENKPSINRAAGFSSDTSRLLLQTARSLDHPGLRDALARLATHAVKPE
jgi:hypothetical protein